MSTNVPPSEWEIEAMVVIAKSGRTDADAQNRRSVERLAAEVMRLRAALSSLSTESGRRIIYMGEPVTVSGTEAVREFALRALSGETT